LPVSCQTPILPPIADFTFGVNNCNGEVAFTDASSQIPQAWSWTFGDGGSSTLQDPTHTYSQNGTYSATLITSNTIGSDTVSYSVVINMLAAPIAANVSICPNTSASLSGTASGSIIWYDSTGLIPLDTAATFTTPILTTNTTYMVENVEFEPIQYVGPLNASIGTSGYHNQPVDFTLNFTSNSPNGFTILSVWVDANTTGTRTINVWDAINAFGNIVGSTTVNITTTGPQRIPINITVPGNGTYSIGGSLMDMRRNNGGVVYPYSIAGVVDIIGSSASVPGFYYYLYDWEIQETACRSTMVPVNVTINPIDSISVSATACDQYTWPANGMTYPNSGIYSANLLNSFGCDSILILNLTINSPNSSSETITECGSYNWPASGTTYTASGVYTTVVPNINGCDSTLTLNLTINPIYSINETVTACASYTWPANGNTYTSSGNYTAALTSINGCDSTISLNLTINTPNSSSETISACGSYSWPASGVGYYTSGTYTTVLTNSNGCDSTLTLNLTINPIYSQSDTVSICSSYTWPANGNTYTSSGNYLAALTSSSGCDSTISLNLTINSVDATVTLTNDVTLQANNASASYQWLNCVGYTPISGATNQSYVASTNGSYAVKVTENGCTDTSICNVISKVGLIENDFGSLFQIYPNPTSGKLTIDLGKEHANVTTKLFNAKGQLINTSKFQNSISFSLEIEGAPGIYFLEIASEDGNFARMEIVKE